MTFHSQLFLESHSKFHGSSHHQPIRAAGTLQPVPWTPITRSGRSGRVSGPTTRQVSTAGISSDFRIDMLQKIAGYSISMIPIDGNKFKALNYPNEVVPHLCDHFSWTSSVPGQMIHTATMKWKAKAQFDVRFMPAWSCWCYLMWCFIWSFKNILEFPRVCWPTGTIVLENPFLTGSEWVSSFQRKELYHLRTYGGGIKAPTFPPISWCFTWQIHKVPPSGSMVPTFSVTAGKNSTILNWLVVWTPLKNDGVRQLGWWHSQLNGKIHENPLNHHNPLIPSVSGKSFKIPWFQSPPSS